MKKTVLFFIMIAASVAFSVPRGGHAQEDVPEAIGETQPFTCDMNFFKAQVPSDWELNEEIITGRIEKVYGFDLKGPKNPEGAFTSITVLYYGPDHPRFHAPEDFIQVNRDTSLSLPGEKDGPLTPVTVAGRAGQEFVRNVFLIIPPYAVEQKKIPMQERLIILPGIKGGFYTLEYSAPEDSYETYKATFEQILTSFKPNA